MRVDRLAVGPLEVNCWIVGSDAGAPVAVIDPGAEADSILAAVGDVPVEAVVLTHGHFDHLGAVAEIVKRTGAPLMVHEADAGAITSCAANGGSLFGFRDVAPPADRLLRDGDRIVVGSLVLEVLATPGHTPGGISLLVDSSDEAHLFSGDTLFAGSVGRTDFPGGDARTLARSLAEKLAPLDDRMLVHPGHGPDSTIARERRINPFWPRS